MISILPIIPANLQSLSTIDVSSAGLIPGQYG
jgi:hypothetical protein